MFWRAGLNLRVSPIRFSMTPDRVQFKIVGNLARALRVSGVSVQVSALSFVLLTPDT
ncbi:hypothetical protein D1AOALGA4SA_12874 [Olavius algarvensis Delta 1 endosymbiont]|nr:hypothetical protein D1AOALGA4SA_12874 [Olavius algarvensis Delta 1 endosymbiont]